MSMVLLSPMTCVLAAPPVAPARPSITVQFGHSKKVTAAVFSPDGALVVTASDDRTAKLWDVFSGAELHTFRGQAGPISSVAISGSSLLATASTDGSVYIWNLPDGRLLRSLKVTSQPLRSVTFSPNNQLLLVSGDDGAAHLYDVATFTEMRKLEGHTGTVFSARFAGDGQTIVTASGDQTVRLWEVSTGREKQVFRHSETVTFATFSPDSQAVMTLSLHAVSLWKEGSDKPFSHLHLLAGERRLDETPELPGDAPIQGLDYEAKGAAFSPDGRSIATIAWQQPPAIWDSQTGEPRRSGFTRADQNISGTIEYAPDGRSVLMPNIRGGASLWAVEPYADFSDIDEGSWPNAVSTDGTWAITATGINSGQVWNLLKGERVHQLDGADHRISRTAISTGGYFAATATGADLWLWDLKSGKSSSLSQEVDARPATRSRPAQAADNESQPTLEQFISPIEPRGPPLIAAVAFGPGSRFVAAGDGSGVVSIWSTRSRRKIRTFDPPGPLAFASHPGSRREAESYPQGVTALTFSQKGDRLLAGSEDCSVRLWDVASENLVRTFSLAALCDGIRLPGEADGQPRVRTVELSKDGSRAMAMAQEQVRVWSVASGRVIYEKHNHAINDPFTAATLTGRGDKLLLGKGGEITFIDLVTGKELKKLNSATMRVDHLAMLPGDHLFCSGARGEGLQITDVDTGEEQRRLGVPPGSAYPWAKGLEPAEVQRFETRALPVSSMLSRNGVLILESRETSVWDLAEGRPLPTFEHLGGSLRDLSPQGDVAVVGNTSSIRMLSVLTGKALMLPQSTPVGASPATGVSPDARTPAAPPPKPYSPLSLDERSEAYQLVQFSNDGSLLLTGSSYGTIRLWSFASGKSVTFNTSANLESGSFITKVRFTPDGSKLFFATNRGKLFSIDTRDGRNLSTWTCATSSLLRDFLLPDNRTVITVGAEVVVRDALTGQVVRKLSDAATAATLSRDGHLLLLSNATNAPHLVDVEDGSDAAVFQPGDTPVMSANFGANEGSVVTLDAEGVVNIWDVRTGTELATLVNSVSGGWAVVDSAGRFDTNDLDGSAALVWHSTKHPSVALPLQSFMQQFFVPRLLARITDGKDSLPKVPSLDNMRHLPLPFVQVIATDPRSGNMNHVDVDVLAYGVANELGQAGGLRDLRLFRDEQMVGYLPGPLLSGHHTFRNIQLPTSSEAVTFTAYAFNSERVRGATGKETYTYHPVKRMPKAFLLQIGVNHYTNARDCELQFAVNDAADLSRVLTRALQGQGVDVDTPALLTATAWSSRAKRSDVRTALAAIAKMATPDDIVIMSFSGHGYYSDSKDEFYMLPSDVRGSCARASSKLTRSAIAAGDLATWLRPIDAGQMAFILDSCYSASSVEAKEFRPGPMGSRGLGQLAYDKHIRILTASQSDEPSPEYKSLQHGLLSFVLVRRGLVEKKADWKPHDGKILLGEWLSYALEDVPRVSLPQLPGAMKGPLRSGRTAKGPQRPALFDFSGSDTFVIDK